MIYVDIFFIVVISLYCYWLWGLLKAFRSDAPYVPIRWEVLARMMEMVSVPKDGLWIDLGSGDGRVLIAAAQKFGVRGEGIERVGSLRTLSRLKIALRGLMGRIHIRNGNFFTADLSHADVVSFYLLPETSAKLLEKLRRELKPGAVVVFHRYPIPGLALTAEDTAHKIYVAQM